jgi:hypothetical protein
VYVAFKTANGSDSEVKSVPDVGKVTFVKPVVVNVTSFAPEVVRLPPKVIVFTPLFIPVPPFAPATIPVTLEAVPVVL